MAKYEHFRTYVVETIHKRERVVSFVSPANRSFRDKFAYDVPMKVLKGLKIGQKVKFVRVSNSETTYYKPRFKA